MSYILVFYTMVGFATGTIGGHVKVYDWRPIGTFERLELCNDAAKQLNLTEYKCVRNK